MRYQGHWAGLVLAAAAVAVVGASGSAWGAVIVTSEQNAGYNVFTTVPDASASDYLEGAGGGANGVSSGPNSNGASISASLSSYGGNGGGLSVLTDGVMNPASENDGDVSTSYFQADGTGYNFTINLGSSVSIEQFNTYSAHTDARLPQNYILIGSNSSNFSTFTTLATVNAGTNGPSPAPVGGELGVSIHDDSQTGILPNGAPIGQFQYLQMQVQSDTNNTGNGHGFTFYKEIDVIVGTPEPASLGLMALGAIGMLGRRRRR
jgi:hypothetical protein